MNFVLWEGHVVQRAMELRRRDEAAAPLVIVAGELGDAQPAGSGEGGAGGQARSTEALQRCSASEPRSEAVERRSQWRWGLRLGGAPHFFWKTKVFTFSSTASADICASAAKENRLRRAKPPSATQGS